MKKDFLTNLIRKEIDLQFRFSGKSILRQKLPRFSCIYLKEQKHPTQHTHLPVVTLLGAKNNDNLSFGGNWLYTI